MCVAKVVKNIAKHFFFSSLSVIWDKSFSLGNAHASMALRSILHDFIVHGALVLVLTFIILEKLLNRLDLEKTLFYVRTIDTSDDKFEK